MAAGRHFHANRDGTVHFGGVDGAAHIWASVMDAGVPVDATVGADADADADPLLMTDML